MFSLTVWRVVPEVIDTVTPKPYQGFGDINEGKAHLVLVFDLVGKSIQQC